MSSVNDFGQPVGAKLETALPRPFPLPARREGHWGFIEPLAVRHAPDLFAAFEQDPAGYTYLPFEPLTSEAACRAFIAEMTAKPDPQFYAICTPEGRAVGHGSYLRITPAAGVAEVGWIHYGTPLQRTPLASEAMFLMMSHVFDDLGYRRYEWKCDALNAPSRRAAARFGFTFEGVFRQATTYKGRNRDTAWFSMLNIEWPAIRAEFTRWLAPENFDHQGRQKTRLAMTNTDGR